MALTDSEITRIKVELGYHVLSINAEPYIGLSSLFAQVIQPYTLSGAKTTSSTPVTAATSPTPQSLVLASATGFTAGDVVVVDVDTRQEKATIQNVVGSTITVLLSLAHTGTFPVTIEGGESIIREILRELALLSSGMNGASGAISALRSRAGIKRVEDIEFFGGGSTLATQGVDPLTQILQLREHWRDELASVLGIPRLNARGGPSAGGSDIAMY